MLPILISLGPVKIYSFGVVMAIGFFLGLYWWWKMGRDEHWDEISLFDGFFLTTIIFLVVGRVGYVLLNMGEVGTLYRSLAFLAFPGINPLIGLLAATIFMILFARAQDWQVWKVMDSYVVTLAILVSLGALGGLLNGSNPGKEVSWGMVYPGETMARIPVDLWIFIWSLVTFAVVSRVRKNFRFYAWYKGESSVAKEGLAALIFVISVGVYYLVAGFINQLEWNLLIFPGESLLGMMLMGVGGYLISQRIGRRDDTLWGKLKGSILNIKQKLRKRSI